MTPGRRSLVGVAAGASLAIALLLAAGRATSLDPSFTSWSAAETWYQRVGPATAALAGLRLAALGSASWLLAAAALQLLAGLSPSHAVQRLADAVSPAVVRQLSHGVAGLAVGVGLLGPPTPTTSPTDPPGTAVMVVLDPVPPTTTTTTTTTTVPTTSAPMAPPDDQVVVESGDSFWSLSVDALADVADPPPIDGYWRRMVAANRPRLVDPGNPDLLYPGQVLTLPAIET